MFPTISITSHNTIHFIFCNAQDIEELMSLAPEKILLRWMNFQLKKAGYKKTVTNFSSDVKVYALSNIQILVPFSVLRLCSLNANENYTPEML